MARCWHLFWTSSLTQLERRRGVVQERKRRGKVRAVLMLSLCWWCLWSCCHIEHPIQISNMLLCWCSTLQFKELQHTQPTCWCFDAVRIRSNTHGFIVGLSQLLAGTLAPCLKNQKWPRPVCTGTTWPNHIWKVRRNVIQPHCSLLLFLLWPASSHFWRRKSYTLAM